MGKGWKGFKENCYQYVDTAMTWAEAEAVCNSKILGGGPVHLASVHSEEENSFVSSLIKENSWLGGHDRHKDGDWTWSDGSPFNYRNWGKGEPNNQGASKDEDCLELYTSKYSNEWNDVSCSRKMKFVCKSSRVVSGCPVGWTVLNSNCYKFFNTMSTWEDAENHCHTEGGHLASVHSKEENDLVSGLYETAGFSSTVIFLGATDVVTEGAWKWSDGSPMDFKNWAPNQPSNDHNKQHCLEINFGKFGLWNDRKCDSAYKARYVCKKTIKDSYLYLTERRILKLPSFEDVTCKQDFPEKLTYASAGVITYNNQQELMVCGSSGMTGCKTWTKNGWVKTAASFPRHRAASSMTASGAWLCTGGWDIQAKPLKPLKTTKLYTRSGWQDFTELPVATHSHCQVLGENKRVYVIGGRTNGYITTDTTYELTTSNKWVKLSSLNTPRSRHLCVEWEGGILAIGGQGVKYGVTLSSVEKFNPLKNKWLPFTALPIPLFGGQTFNWEGDVFVLGGWTPGKSKSVHNNEVFKLKKGSQTWEVVPGVGISHGNRKIYPAVIIKNLHCNN